MELLDIHTHRLPGVPYQSIVSCTPEELPSMPPGYYSVGYHPWNLRLSVDEYEENLLTALKNPQVIAIGEAGLDKLKETDYGLQKDVFRMHIRIATEKNLPLIIHAVRSFNDILDMCTPKRSDIPCIIHGFRGKKELAGQLTAHGFYLSFGEHYQEEALKSAPSDRLFLETDDSREDIMSLYRRAADILSMPADSFKNMIGQNIRNVFFHHTRK